LRQSIGRARSVVRRQAPLRGGQGRGCRDERPVLPYTGSAAARRAGLGPCPGAGDRGCRATDSGPQHSTRGRAIPMLSGMFAVTEAEAAAIRAIFEQRGELSAAVELRRRFPGIADNAQARECVRTIAGWRPPHPMKRPRLPRLAPAAGSAGPGPRLVGTAVRATKHGRLAAENPRSVGAHDPGAGSAADARGIRWAHGSALRRVRRADA